MNFSWRSSGCHFTVASTAADWFYSSVLLPRPSVSAQAAMQDAPPWRDYVRIAEKFVCVVRPRATPSAGVTTIKC